MTFKELMQQLKAAKSTPECIAVELDALAAARNGNITKQERDQLIAESRLMRKRMKERLTAAFLVAIAVLSPHRCERWGFS